LILVALLCGATGFLAFSVMVGAERQDVHSDAGASERGGDSGDGAHLGIHSRTLRIMIDRPRAS
jgi:hypothetical protein